MKSLYKKFTEMIYPMFLSIISAFVWYYFVPKTETNFGMFLILFIFILSILAALAFATMYTIGIIGLIKQAKKECELEEEAAASTDPAAVTPPATEQ